MLSKLLKLLNLQLIPIVTLSRGEDKNDFTCNEINKEEEVIPVVEETVKVIPVKKVKKTILTIYFVNNVTLSWDNESFIGDKTFAWSEFYTWFFARKTPLFVLKYKTGETTFRREDILRVVYLKPVEE